MALALEGLCVLDLSRVLAGPYACMVLADLGADVVKVEMPGRGDDARAYPPYIEGESAYFMSLNRNKRSVTLDLKNPAGRRLLTNLAAKADVLVENYRPGAMARLGLAYDDLRQTNPRLIYAAISGFGQTGPYAQRPAYDAVVQALSGLMSITGPEGGPPTRVGTSIADVTAGLFAVIGILAALYRRQETGVGQMVDVAMLDSVVAVLENAVARFVATGEVPAPLGNRHPAIFPFEPFDTADGQVMVAAGNDDLWGRLCSALALPSLASDPRFRTNPLRHDNYRAMREILSEAFIQRTTEEWRAILDAAGVPNGAINSIADLVQDPQIAAREMLQDVVHPVAGRTIIPGIPIKLSQTPGTIRRPAPLLGEQTGQVLIEWLGLSGEELAGLRNSGAIG
ncbi:MAG: CoA transferase [Chloroflexi bacterium]|nr:CoA transferase [Chloroflexota bacterium]